MQRLPLTLAFSLAVASTASCGDDGTTPEQFLLALETQVDIMNAIGDTLYLAAILEEATGGATAGIEIVFSTLDPDIVSVATDGETVSLAVGTAEVVATAPSLALSDTALIVVQQVPAEVVATPPSMELFIGFDDEAMAVVRDSNEVVVPDAVVEWDSESDGIATVSASGLVEGVSEGDVEIYAVSDEVADTIQVSVVPAPPPGEWNEPLGFTPIVIRPFDTKASANNDRGTGDFPEKTGGSEGWDGFEWQESNLSIASAPTDPLSPGNAMRFTYPEGLAANNGPGVSQTQGLGSPTNLYVRTSVRLGPTYYAGAVSNKLYFHRMNGDPRGEPFIALHSNGDGTFQLATNFQGTPDNGLGWFYASAPGDALERETWYVIETLLIMSSGPGAQDGIFRMWVDDTLVVERTDVEYVTASGATTFGTLHVSPTFGGSAAPNDTEFYWDLGHAYVSGSN